MRIAFFVTLFLFVVIILGCDKQSGPKYLPLPTESTFTEEGLQYFKDKRTSLCFAIYREWSASITNVPCTPEVEKLLSWTLR